MKMLKKLIKRIVGAIYCIRILANSRTLGTITYNDLWRTSFCYKNFFVKYKKRIIERNIKCIKEKKDMVRVAFVVYTSAMWTVDKLYHSFVQNDKYEADIIIARFWMEDEEASESTFEKTVKYFQEKKYNIITLEDESFDVSSYDLLIYTTPYDFVEEKINLLNISLNCLVCYISYSYMLVENYEKINLPMYILSWFLFCDSSYYKRMVEDNIRINTNNALYLGYPKMDDYYSKEGGVDKCEFKTIIYAPHHSVTYKNNKSSTFDINYRMIIEIARKYQNQIRWILKPHPMMAARCIEAGIFENYEKYQEYLDEWKNLRNAMVVSEGDYFDLFKMSDGMITDSISFLAEYQFTGKPLLLLESGLLKYNEFGDSVKEILYSCMGDDRLKIESFVENTVLDENDPMKSFRRSFYMMYLDYYSKQKKFANDIIYEMFMECLG